MGIIRQTNGKFVVENYELQKDYFHSRYNMYNGLSEKYVNRVFETIWKEIANILKRMIKKYQYNKADMYHK